MKQIFNKSEYKKYLKNIDASKYFNDKEIDYSIFIYEKGEFLYSPTIENKYIKLIINGEISIYSISSNGNIYVLNGNNGDFCVLGDIEFFYDITDTIYAEALSKVVCIAISNENKEKLQRDTAFLYLIGNELAKKLIFVTQEGNKFSTTTKIINYLKYNCKNNTFKGIEKVATILNCSSRQLQRVLNKLETENIVRKVGKGSYQLLEFNEV